jgi:hypothetical protein
MRTPPGEVAVQPEFLPGANSHLATSGCSFPQPEDSIESISINISYRLDYQVWPIYIGYSDSSLEQLCF